MAKYRQLYTDFWNDGFVLDLTPEEKYFYVYLMTNPKTSQCGIYELPMRIIETQTGYNRETIEKLLQRFVEYKKVGYCSGTKEIMLVNWIKYNTPNNHNAIKCINNELKKVKNTLFITMYYELCLKYELKTECIFDGLQNILQGVYKGVGSPSQGDDKGEGREKEEYNGENAKCEENQEVGDFDNPLTRGFEGACKGVGSNRSNKEEVKEVIKKKEEVINNKEEIISNKEEVKEVISKDKTSSDPQNFSDVIKTFQNNIHTITPIEYDKLLAWSKDFTCDVIIMAIDEAVSYNAKTMNYINKILECWLKKEIKTSQDVLQYQKLWEEKKKKFYKDKNKGDSAWNLENDRKYNYEELEKKLLGWDE